MRLVLCCLMIVVLQAWSVGTVLAQEAGCNYDGDQVSMNLCARDEWQLADDSLNQVYRDLQSKTQTPRNKDILRDAQSAWVKFRDLECAYDAAVSYGGSMYPLDYNLCLKKLTVERTKELQGYINCTEDSCQR